MKELEAEKREAQAHVRGAGPRECSDQGSSVPKTVEPFAKRQVAEVLVREHGLSIGRACRVARLSRTAWYRRPRSCMKRDRGVIEVLNELVARRPLVTGSSWPHGFARPAG